MKNSESNRPFNERFDKGDDACWRGSIRRQSANIGPARYSHCGGSAAPAMGSGDEGHPRYKK